MSVHIVDDEQRGDRPATPMRPSGSGGAGASAALAFLGDIQRHRLRRAALHLPPRRSIQLEMKVEFVHSGWGGDRVTGGGGPIELRLNRDGPAKAASV